MRRGGAQRRARMKLRQKPVLVIGLAVCLVFLFASLLITAYFTQILTRENVQLQTYEL